MNIFVVFIISLSIMKAYKNIQSVQNQTDRQENNKVVFTYKKLKLISVIFCFMLCFNILGIFLPDIGIQEEITRVTASWTPNISDVGKLKFVNGQESEVEVLGSVSEFAMPFDNVYVTEVSDGTFDVNGLGGIVVKSCFDGKVEKVDIVDGKRNVTIQHKKVIKSVYEGLDTVGVKVGDLVKKNTPIGISDTSEIILKIYFKNKLVTGLSFKDGEMLFL